MGEPVDMFIETMGGGVYDLLVGFPGLEPWVLGLLQSQGAVISFGEDEYEVNDDHFGGYNHLYYVVDGPSFGLGLELQGATWPSATPLPNIKHTLNGCMLFEAANDILNERLDADSIDFYESDQFILAYSTVTGVLIAQFIEAISEQFNVVDTLNNSWEGKHEIRIARFATTYRNALKILFP